jgi:hypothetical protein
VSTVREDRESEAAYMSIKLRRGVLLLAIIVIAGGLLLAVGATSPIEAQS